MTGLYLHIPFCQRRCVYCDFYSTTLGAAERGRYVDALCRELVGRADEAAGPRPGGIMPSTIALWQTPATRVVLGADVPRRQTPHRRSRAIAWQSREKP